MLLTVVGYNPDYSNSESDVFEINQLLDFHRINYDSDREEEEDEDEYQEESEDDEIYTFQKTSDETMDIKESPLSGDFGILISGLLERVETLVVSRLKKNEEKFEEMIYSLRMSKVVDSKAELFTSEKSKSQITKKLKNLIHAYKQHTIGN
jgi:hypothetical protein